MEQFLQDLRFALRTLRKSPVFVTVTVASLALGVGANTAIFTLVDQILLRLLPVKNPEQLVTLWGRGKHYGGNNGLDAGVPVYRMKTLEKQTENSLVTERLVASLSIAFALLATVLATIGLYGVMAYTVARRTREIGVRMALGAVGPDVVWLVMREVLVLVAAGLPTAWGLSKLVTSQLYGIAPNDPLSHAAATLGITLVAILSGYLPARRATRIDPVQALRWE